jgi:cytoskeleton protein RodZ
VLALVMTWGVVWLFTSEPHEMLQTTTPALNGSAGVDRGIGGSGGVAPAPTPKPMNLTLIGAHDPSQVVVRDRAGKVVWAGQLSLGEKRVVRATPPVKVSAQNAGAVEASLNGKDLGTLGRIGTPGSRTFDRSSSR